MSRREDSGEIAQDSSINCRLPGLRENKFLPQQYWFLQFQAPEHRILVLASVLDLGKRRLDPVVTVSGVDSVDETGLSLCVFFCTAQASLQGQHKE